MRCWLTGPKTYSSQLEQSTRYLVNDIENMLIGKPFSVAYREGEILIESKLGK
jgi:hypothetical protein